MKEIIVRRMKTEEYSLLKEFTYMAIYVPHGVKMPPKSIVEQPALKIYYQEREIFALLPKAITKLSVQYGRGL